MLLELKRDPDLPPQIGLLWAQVQDSARRLERAVASISQAELEDRGSDGKGNSIGAIVAHVAFCDLGYAAEQFVAPVPPALTESFGPWRDEHDRLPPVTGVTAADLLKRIHTALGYLRAQLAGLHDSDLERRVPYFGGSEATLAWCLWHVADHHMWHFGQILTARRSWKERQTGGPVRNQIGGVFLPVADATLARDWYSRLLSLPADSPVHFGHLCCPPMDGAALMLDTMPYWRERGEAPPRLALKATDLQAAYEHCQSCGIRLVTGIEHEHWFVVEDPDGNRIMIMR